ncbi:MAG: alpha/beta hydrolase fold domain-containing protein, partial [bacterium]
PDLSRVAVVGHSAGGDLTGDIAAVAVDKGLPQPKAAMLVEAARGKEMQTGKNIPLIPVEDFSKIAASTLMLVVVGDDDTIAGDSDAKIFFKTASKVPPQNKDFIIVHSDHHGTPDLKATHFAPVANSKLKESINALDYYAYWKLFDALSDCAFYRKNCDVALGNTPAQRFMGKWSDGTPVKELTVTDHP